MSDVNPDDLDLGLDTFGDVTRDASGARLTDAETIRNVVEQAVLADQVGLAFFGVGEHHRPEFAISSPEIVLAAAAARTQNIHLGTAVTVLSSDDPVRVYERFATLDAISRGRAEVILGRGSFIESFPLFGYDLRDYEVLFEEKLDLFTRLLEEKPVTWQGSTRAPLEAADAFPGFESMNNTIGRERGWPPYSRMRFQHDVGPEGSIYAGSPETVARKIADTVRTLGAERFDMKFSTGTLSHDKLMKSIELYGTRVAP